MSSLCRRAAAAPRVKSHMTVNSLDFGRIGDLAQPKLAFPGWEHLISDRLDLGLDIHFKVRI